MGETHLMGITYTREGAGAREYIPYSERRVFCLLFGGPGPRTSERGPLTNTLGWFCPVGLGVARQFHVSENDVSVEQHGRAGWR